MVCGAWRVRALPKDAQSQCCCAGIVLNTGLSKRKPAASHGLQATFGSKAFRWWSLPGQKVEYFRKFSTYATCLKKRLCEVSSHEFGTWQQCTLLKNVLEMLLWISYSEGLSRIRSPRVAAFVHMCHVYTWPSEHLSHPSGGGASPLWHHQFKG